MWMSFMTSGVKIRDCPRTVVAAGAVSSTLVLIFATAGS
jgi:hypothetical protein